MINKNLLLLTLSHVFGFTVPPVTIFLSGIIGTQISPIKSLSLLPIALSYIGTAVFTIVAAKIMSIIGRKLGFILSAIVSTLSSLLAAYSVLNQNFILFNFSCFSFGFGIAFGHQYRFAAAESVEKDQAPKAISILFLAGIASALIGPNLATYTKSFISEQLYVGSYLSLAALTFTPIIFLLFYKNNVKLETGFKYKGRGYLELISQPRFLQSIVTSALAFAIMSFLMTATPVSMHIMEKMSLEKTGIVIQIHIVCMFLPSLITGLLIKKHGTSLIIYTGVTFFLITIGMSLFEQTFANYLVALIFLGLGWNFLFISGTSLVVLTYKEEEKFRVQGINDLIVFSTMALASLSAGILLSLTNWKTMNLICVPFLILIIAFTLRANLIYKKN